MSSYVNMTYATFFYWFEIIRKTGTGDLPYMTKFFNHYTVTTLPQKLYMAILATFIHPPIPTGLEPVLMRSSPVFVTLRQLKHILDSIISIV